MSDAYIIITLPDKTAEGIGDIGKSQPADFSCHPNGERVIPDAAADSERGNSEVSGIGQEFFQILPCDFRVLQFRAERD